MFGLFGKKHNCYCAFCKSPRRIYRKKNIGVINIIASALASYVFMMILWQTFDPRVMIVFVVCLALAEAFIKLRWRLSLACAQCGFDPVLYLKDQQKALAQVQEKIEVRRNDPKYLLAKPLALPKISADRAKALQNTDKKGQLVSRQI